MAAGPGLLDEAAAQDAVGRLKARIGDFVEPLTRFDRSHLSILEAQSLRVAVKSQQRFSAAFRSQTQTGAGALPRDAEIVSNAVQRDQRIDALLDQARTNAVVGLQTWAKSHAGPPTSRPGVNDCFAGAPTLGFSWTCQACAGAGETTCHQCGGRRDIECPGCGGQGEKLCWTCSGGRQVSCATCSGRGSYWTQESRTVWNDATKSSTVEYYQVTHACHGCGGSGKNNCNGCNGHGKLTCGTCNGLRRINCPTCGASGRVACKDCSATGIKHEFSRIECSINEKLSIEVASGVDEIDATLGGAQNAETLVALADAPPECTIASDGEAIERNFIADCPVASAVIVVGREQVIIRGFGPEMEVYDFKNVAGLLLDGDMDRLEDALSAPSLLVPALSDALASEAHLLIAEHAATGTFDPAAFSVAEFKSAVAPDYVQRAAKSLRQAIGKAYWLELMRGPVWVLATPLPVVLLAVFALGLPLWSWEPIGLAAVITLAGGYGAHAWIVKRFLSLFRGLNGARVARVLGRLRLTRNWWIAVGVSAIAGSYLSVQAVTQIMRIMFF